MKEDRLEDARRPLSDIEMYERNPQAWGQATRLMDALALIETKCSVCGDDDAENLHVIADLENPRYICHREDCDGG